eukprot:Hpha_TRINITY_DN31388_c0_g1::TRINITY_DN31388_c0_g1_i1::g.194447::m.194447
MLRRAAAVLLLAVGGRADTAAVTVDPANVTHQVSNFTLGCHSDSGYTHQPRGLYSQLIYGESFEEGLPSFAQASGDARPLGRFTIQPAGDKHGNRLRHCSYQLFSTPSAGPSNDFNFDVIPGLDGKPDTVSFRSANYPSKYIQLVPTGTTGVEPGRLGISAANTSLLTAASWRVSGGLKDSSGNIEGVQITNALTGGAMYLNGKVSGQCASSYKGAAGASDVVLASPATTGTTFNLLTPPPPPLIWRNYTRGDGVEANVSLDSAFAFHGKASQRVEFMSGTGVVGLANRGLGAEGLYFEANKVYEGYFFAASAHPVTLTVELQLKDGGHPIAATTVAFAGGNWTRVNFTLTTSQGTVCVGVDPSSPEALSIDCGKMGSGGGHVCVSCGGQVMVGLAAPGTVHIDYVYLEPGPWGRFADLPVLKTAVDTLRGMGVSIIRQGGSFTDPAQYFWKRWRGAPWERP